MVMLMEGNRLKPADVKSGETVRILNEGAWVEDSFKQTDGTFQKSNAFVASVEYKGQTKDMKFTKATRENLKEAWGPDTQEWVNKSAQIALVPTEKGKSIMLTPLAWEE